MGVYDIKSGAHEAYIKLQIAAYWELERNGTDDNLEFDEIDHIFKVNGNVIPSVTHIIRANGMMPGFYKNINPWYLERGKYIHLATEFFDKGTLDEDSVDEAILPHVEAYKTFKGDFEGVITSVERKLYHPQLLYAGIIDRTIEGNTCYVLHLKPGKNPPYQFIEVKNIRSHFNYFLSALNVLKWREENLKEIS